MKRVLVIRYGAHGDAIQASSIFPVLKQQGWQVAVDTTTPGEEVLRHDPNIDLLMVTDVKKADAQHIEHRAHGFHRLIVLNDATEGALLKLPDRLDFHWPDSARRRVCNVNYVEHLHLVADVPFERNQQRFYPTPDEKVGAEQFKARLGGRPMVLWVLAGSAQHKIWPGLARGIVRVLQETEAHVVAIGGPTDQELAKSVQAFGDGYFADFRRRTIWVVGSKTVRESMAMACAADVVVGPETGLLNAAAMEANAKVVMLSHSTRENLTRDWVNTISLEPDRQRAPCWPCHRLHRDKQFCPQDKTTELSACASSIDVDTVVGAITAALGKGGR